MSMQDIFINFPRLETKRLVLRQITAGDVDALFAIFSDAQVMQFGNKLQRSKEEAQEFFGKLQNWYHQQENVQWGITLKGNDTLLGSCGFYAFDEGFLRADLGYELRPAYWRQGIMSEALTTIISFAFATMGLHRIEAVVYEGNERSLGILRKMGFVEEGLLRQRTFFHERFWDEHHLGLLKDEWQVSI